VVCENIDNRQPATANGVEMRNIVLVGFMGTGKTAVGKLLAARLKKSRLCLDDMIEWKVGKPIVEIFNQDGESFFRKVEKDIVKAASRDNDVIIDAGGGVVIDEDNIKNLKNKGIIICLKARPEVTYQRTKGQIHRPLLNTPNPIDSIKALLDEREKYYNRADYTIETSGLTPDEVAEKIIDIIEEQ
jgi:shikimate kinase